MKIIEEVLKSTDMGIHAINDIREYIEDENLAEKVLKQREKMKNVQMEAEQSLSQDEIDEAKINKVQKVMTGMSTKMTAMMDKSSSHIAEMLIEGTNMGINAIQKIINEMEIDGNEIPELAIKTMKMYQQNINDLRCFL